VKHLQEDLSGNRHGW